MTDSNDDLVNSDATSDAAAKGFKIISEKKQREQRSLTPSEVSQLGLRNGQSPEEIQARIDQVFPPA